MLNKFSKKDFTATNILIIITVLVYILQINISSGGLLLGLNLYFLVYDFWWQPLTTMFAHGGIGHLGMNMFVLWQFGNYVERSRGTKAFVLLYLITGVLTSLFSFLYIFFLDIPWLSAHYHPSPVQYPVNHISGFCVLFVYFVSGAD